MAETVYYDPSFPNLFVYKLTTDPNNPDLVNGYKRYPTDATVILMASIPRERFKPAELDENGVPITVGVMASAGDETLQDGTGVTAGMLDSGPPPDDSDEINVLVDDVFDALGINTEGEGTAVPNSDTSNGTVNDDSDPGGYTVSDDGADTLSGGGTLIIEDLVNRINAPINPEPNILDRFATYNYSISLYILDDADINLMLISKQKIIPPNSLLIQSAGIPNGTDNPLGNFNDFDLNNTSQRNQFFDVDFFIDNLNVTSLVPGKGTQTSTNNVELDFTVTEPYGITLLDRMYNAVNALNNGNRAKNYAAQNFLLVVRFYGYDKDGNLITNVNQGVDTSDRYAFVEKFIPIVFKNITFRISNNITEYTCSAVVPQNQVATGQARGMIPFNVELEGATLNQLFNGSGGAFDVAPAAPQNIGAATSSATTEGLIPALNRYQNELVQQGVQELPDRYRLLMPHPEIANAKIVPPGGLNRSDRPLTIAETTGARLNPGASGVDNSQKTTSASAGMMIAQYIDQNVRNSEYIYNQQKYIINDQNKVVPQQNNANSFTWFRVGIQARPIGYDFKRNDYAYEITYEIAPYGISFIKSNYFPNGEYIGSQKTYNYWYTGENTQILRYEQEFNYLYFLTINNNTNIEENFGTSNYREIEKRLFQKNSNESNQGSNRNVNEPAANAAEYLYSPGDQARVSINIIGDPAWLGQGEVWSGVRSDGSNSGYDPYSAVFLPDGTINFDARETLFEINFKKPVDYRIDTGVMDTTNSYLQTYVYRAIKINSKFSKGQFTQDLDGALIVFPNLQEQRYLTGISTLPTFPQVTTEELDNRPIGEVLPQLGSTPSALTGVDSTNIVTGPTQAQQSPGSARAIGQQGFNMAGDENNALDALAEDAVTLGENQIMNRDP